MKKKFIALSDLHMEGQGFGATEEILSRLGEADFIILAGDITTRQALLRGTGSLDNLIDACRERANHVIALIGNHEAYRSGYWETVDFMREYYDDRHVAFLHNSFLTIDGVKFFGGPLWTDFDRDCPLAKLEVSRSLNDFYLIQNDLPGLKGQTWSADNALHEHKRFLEVLDHQNECQGGIDVVVSHHAPHPKSSHPKWATSGLVNYGFYSDLGEVIDRVSPKLWVHGHMHDPSDYVVGDTRVYCNPRGYRGERPAPYVMDDVIEIEVE